MFIATARHEGPGLLTVLGELLFGVAIGVAVSALVTMAWRLEVLTAEPRLQPLGPLAVAVVVYGTCHLTHANPYLAAFAAGSTPATLDHGRRRDIRALRRSTFGNNEIRGRAALGR